MKEFKNFQAYEPGNSDLKVEGSESDGLPYDILYMKDESGNDWYDLQKQLSQNTVKVVYDDTGTVIQFSTDASVLYPLGFSVVEIEKSNFCSEDDKPLRYLNGQVSVDYAKAAEETRKRLLASANAATTDWRTELQLETISDEDKSSLIEWMAYIKALRALDFSGVTDEAGYKAIEWPDKPE
ncbi:tail fiber assembly protein [Enterobacter hormaechei]|uniref:tail fiber assembly protein n=1 Tax=Enterobacter hormaechei TaxID=158836 RepID=UPI000F883B32|nr:tail fiber assembly protein [Enterobacter hormaechei]RTO96158.1 hypothetical protein EKN57_22455 [Enterobacter hormaechei]